MPQYVNVTQENIDRAVKNCSSRCAVADAIKDAVPKAVRIRVDMQTIRWTDPVKQVRYIYLTPARAQQYIIAFDAGDKIQPFQFRLDTNSRQVVPSNPMPAEVQQGLHERARLSVTNKMVASKVGGKAPPVMGPSTTRGYGVCGLRVNQDRAVEINRDVDAKGGE
jgi:hypothetical protein